jgi:SAM-dependent methyltransferase
VSAGDSAFVGSIPALYDRHLGQLLFAPYAAELAARARAEPPARVLEIAAGTGIVTRALHAALPAAAITATDLNAAMVAYAADRVVAPNVTWRAADAMALPFGAGEFDLIVCQFGAMFFPDRLVAFREAHRVLAPGGRMLMTMWAPIDDNEVADLVSRAAAAAFPDDPPSFLTRTPYGHGDPVVTESQLHAAGFARVDVARVDARSRSGSAADPAIGFCQGSPLRGEIEARDAGRLAEITEAATRAVAARFGDGPIDAAMRAYVFDARR